MNKVIFICIALLVAINCEATQIQFADLAVLIEKNNKRVLSKDYELKAAKNREGHFARSLLPSVDLTASYESFRTGEEEQRNQPAYGAEATLNIYNGGIDKLKSKRHSLVAERRMAEKKLTLSEQLDQAGELYWHLIFERDTLKLLNDALKRNEENLNAANKRIRAGVSTRSDKFEFEMNKTEIEQEIENTKISINAVLRKLASIISVDNLQLSMFTEPLSHNHNWESEIKHEHEIHSLLTKPADLLSEEKEIELKEVKRGWLPKIEVFTAYNQFNEREEDYTRAIDRTETVVGVRLKMHLFDGLKLSSESSALHQEIYASKLISELQKQEIEVDIENELSDLKLKHSQVHQAEENIQLADQYYKLTKQEYSRGAKNSPDMLGASEKLLQTKRKHLAIIRDFQIARSHLLSKTGLR